jgi:8-oxo-dGTP pyrophosphatase MutT (NUDIX family)
MSLYVRRSARVFVTDDAGRVLLLRCNMVTDRPEEGQIWVAPGGGVEAGESSHETAARELWEEIRLKVAPEALLPQVAFIEGHADINGLGPGLYREDYFHLGTAGHEVDDSGQEDFERRQINEYRWWTLDGIRASTELLVPLGMADLLGEVAAGRVPARPVALPFHH